LALRWTYSREGQQAEPAVFHVYHDGGSGVIDFGHVVASIAYRRGQFHYQYLSGAFPEGTRIQWAVRAASSGGAEEVNEYVVAGRSRVEPPPVNPAVVMTRIEASGW
jgi:hypothetical protein